MVLLWLTFCYSCQENTQQKATPADHLLGSWVRTSTRCLYEKTILRDGCPVPDVPIEDLVDPTALGRHVLIQKDSLAIFNYPFEYFGTYPYEALSDTLFFNDKGPTQRPFFIQKNHNDTLTFHIHVALSNTCILFGETTYKRFKPDSTVIAQLIQDTLSCDSLIGQWWYLRKSIHYEDGASTTYLNFPKGMPDSILLTADQIKQDPSAPFDRLVLNDRPVKMYLKAPNYGSFTLEPAVASDRILFSRFFEDGISIDTVCDRVLYQRWSD